MGPELDSSSRPYCIDCSRPIISTCARIDDLVVHNQRVVRGASGGVMPQLGAIAGSQCDEAPVLRDDVIGGHVCYTIGHQQIGYCSAVNQRRSACTRVDLVAPEYAHV